MTPLLRSFALAAAGAAALALYRQWRAPDPQRRRHHLDTWENEGGALPESAPHTWENEGSALPESVPPEEPGRARPRRYDG